MSNFSNRQPILIALGTGRCGSTSLAKFLNLQPNCNITHEADQYHLHWTDSYSLIETRLNSYCKKQSASPNQIFGDVHFAYLPYVFQIAKQFTEVRFICLVRDKRETVASWVRKIEKRNPWINHQGELFDSSPWDQCFPKTGNPNPKNAAESYWDLYQQTAKALRSEFPQRFAMFPTESLNSREGQKRILDFVGVCKANRIYDFNLRENQSVRKDLK